MSSSSFLKALKRCVSACKKYNDDYPPLSADTGVLKALRESSGAGRFNSIYRGKDLGLTTSENLANISQRIANGFEDLYCGDTLTGVSSGKLYYLADADYRRLCGDGVVDRYVHHILVVPSQSFGSYVMNDTATTEGAYVGSKMYTTYLPEVFESIISDFGENHILPYRTYLENAVVNGKASSHSMYTRKLDLMTEAMICGGNHMTSSVSDGVNYLSCGCTVDNARVSLFNHRKDIVNDRLYSYWLRNVASSTSFSMFGGHGDISRSLANSATGVRPVFLIY